MGVLKYALNNNLDPLKEQEIIREYNRMLTNAKYNYKSISTEEKKKIVFTGEMENELFNQLVSSENPDPALARQQSPATHVEQGNTRAPGKLRGSVQCYRDHGAGYTVRRTLYHMGLWEDEEAPESPENRPKLISGAERFIKGKREKKKG